MAQVKFDDVIDSIPSFTSDQLKQLQASVAFNMSDCTSKSSDTNDDEKEILQALSQALSSEGIKMNISCSLLRNVPGWRTRVMDFEDFIEYFQTQSKVRLKRVEKSFLLKLLFRLLIKDIKSIGLRITPKTIVNNMSRIADIFDQSFPDYMRSGLAYFVISHKKQART